MSLNLLQIAFGMKSTMIFATVSRKIRFLPTKRYSTSFGNIGRARSNEGGTVDKGAVERYVPLTLTFTDAADSADLGLPSPRIVAFADSPSFPPPSV